MTPKEDAEVEQLRAHIHAVENRVNQISTDLAVLQTEVDNGLGLMRDLVDDVRAIRDVMQ